MCCFHLILILNFFVCFSCLFVCLFVWLVGLWVGGFLLLFFLCLFGNYSQIIGPKLNELDGGHPGGC